MLSSELSKNENETKNKHESFFQINKRLLGLPDEAENKQLRVCEGWILSETKERQVQ